MNAMDNEIDITKPVQTRDGREVTQVHSIANSVVGNLDGQARCWSLTGRSSLYWRSQDDIENVPEPKYAWINVYNSVYNIGAGCVGGEHQSRDAAIFAAKDMAGGPTRWYVLRLNVDTGETVREPY